MKLSSLKLSSQSVEAGGDALDLFLRDLLASGARAGEVWRFPDSAVEALAALDPREPFLIEFLFRDDSVATARFEAGDFAAARAFLAMGPV